MAVRRPLVIIAGQVQELPAIDTVGTGTAIVPDFPLIKKEVPLGITLTVPVGFQFLVANTFSVIGNIDNEGEVVII